MSSLIAPSPNQFSIGAMNTQAIEQAPAASIDRALGLNAKNLALHAAAASGDHMTCAALLSEGANPNRKDVFGCTPLFRAASVGCALTCQVLLDSGARLEDRTFEHSTPLIAAARHGRAEVVALIASRGARLNAKDMLGRTALSCAALEGHHGICQLLIESGCDLVLLDALGRTPLMAAAANGQRSTLELIRDALVNLHSIQPTDHPALDPHATDDCGNAPLHAAALGGHLDAFRSIMAMSLDLGLVNTAGETALHKAAESGHPIVLAELLEACTRKCSDARRIVDAKDKSGNAALHVAILSATGTTKKKLSVVSTCHQLVHAGADLDVINAQGQTPLHLAAIQGLRDVCLFLIQSGANPRIKAKGVMAAGAAGRAGHSELSREMRACHSAKMAADAIDLAMANRMHRFGVAPP